MELRAGIRAVLFDRDGTLVVDVPYNGDPDRVQPMPGAARAVARVRAAGLRTAVVSNQSGIGRGLVTADQVEQVNARVDERIGPFDRWAYCPHVAADGCRCRKPAPGMILQVCRALGIGPRGAVVIGDIGADVVAAGRAGAQAILVPTAVTRPEEIAAATVTARDLAEAVDLVLARCVADAEAVHP